jgi:hypothetical protein
MQQRVGGAATTATFRVAAEASLIRFARRVHRIRRGRMADAICAVFQRFSQQVSSHNLMQLSPCPCGC